MTQLDKTDRRPTAREWIWFNFRNGSISFGGNGRVLLYREKVVDQEAWMTKDTFQETHTLGQVLPGPTLVNLAMSLGCKLVGPLPAGVALVVLGLPGALMAIGVLHFLDLQNPSIRWLLQGFSIGGLIAYAIALQALSKGLSKNFIQDRKLPRHKLMARVLIVALVAGAVLKGVPLGITLCTAAAICLLVEFRL